MVLEKLNLAGRVAIVTGGSRGLGREIALHLSAAGANVCIASRSAETLDSTATFIEGHTGQRPLTVPTNVQSSEQCDALVAATVEHFGQLDIMVNNAGIGDARGGGSAIATLEDADWHDTIEVNLYSTFYCSRAAARHMLARGGGGAILNVASGTALRGYPQGFAYAAAKAGVISLTKSSAASLAGEQIRVNCIIPGFLAQAPPASERESEMRASRGRFNTSGRLGEAWEMGPLAVFLCSDAAAYITGESFVIDGGGLSGGVAPTGFAPDFPTGATDA